MPESLSSLLQKAWRKLIVKHWDLIWLERDLSPPAPSGRPEATLIVRELLAEDLSEARLGPYFGPRAAQYQRMLAGESRCYAALLPETQVVAGLMWGHVGRYFDADYFRCHFEAPGDCLYLFAGEVAPEHRGTTLPFRVMAHAWETAAHEGLRRVRVVVGDHNTPALRLHMHLGYREVGEFVRVHHWFRGVLVTSRTHRYTGERLSGIRDSASPKPSSAV